MTGRTSRLALVCALTLAALAGRAAARGHAKPEPPPPLPLPAAAPADADRAKALLTTIETGADASARLAAIKDLAALGPRVVAPLADYLHRDHAAKLDDRREVLKKIKAQVPDKNGQFHTPPQLRDAARDADDKIDWLADLLQLDAATPGLGEVIGDVAAIRALAASKDIGAAQVIVDASFADATIIYRDECGRRLREMAPYSIPALTIASQDEGYDRKRYATYQLERLDRQEPEKALAAAAGDEALRVAILDAFRVTHHREAVHAVLAAVDDDSPRVRAAARAAWMAYVSGPPPPAAPKKKLVLPGGKTDVKETPLWLTYRDLADNDLRKASADLLGKAYDEKEKIDLEAVSAELFKHYDAERQQRDAATYASAAAKAKGGDLAGAAAILDQLLAANPDPPQKAEMAQTYLALGKELEGKQAWRDAAAAYEKAVALDPKGAGATDAQAGHDYALGKALQADGKDGGAAFRRAAALKPDHGDVKQEAARSTGGGGARQPWMLYGAAGAGALALLFFAIGLRRRTAS